KATSGRNEPLKIGASSWAGSRSGTRSAGFVEPDGGRIAGVREVNAVGYRFSRLLRSSFTNSSTRGGAPVGTPCALTRWLAGSGTLQVFRSVMSLGAPFGTPSPQK